MTGLIVDSTGLTLSTGGLFLETGLGSATLTQGVPLRITIDGVVYERLIGADGAWLTGADGLPLYGRV